MITTFFFLAIIAVIILLSLNNYILRRRIDRMQKQIVEIGDRLDMHLEEPTTEF